MPVAERWYSHVRLVSGDVAAAALGGGVLAVRATGSSPRPSFYWLLPAGVWVVYTLDHLLDARQTGSSALTPRHRFHYEHARPLWVAMIAVGIFCAFGGWIGLSTFGLMYAAGMCGLVAGHESIVKLTGDRASPLLVKELGVAVVFTAGVWGMPWLRHRLDTGRWFGWPAVLMVQYLLLAVVNLIEFAIFEARIDQAQGQTSFVRGIGRRRAGRVVVVLLMLQIPLGLFALSDDRTGLVPVTEVIYTAMTVGLWVVLKVPRWSARFERYRTLGDGVFLLPLLVWFV